jgi:hypothetical protein
MLMMLKAAGSQIPGLIAMKLLCPLKDPRSVVERQKILALGIIAKNWTWTQQCWDSVKTEIVEKLGDERIGELAKESLYCMAESTNST